MGAGRALALEGTKRERALPGTSEPIYCGARADSRGGGDGELVKLMAMRARLRRMRILRAISVLFRF